MDNNTFTQNMDTLFSDLHNLVKSDTVLGTPVPVGDKTLVPVMSVTLGYGSTGMGKKSQSDNTTNSSNGIGLGARVSTNAVVVIDKNSVQMLPVNEKSNMGQIMEKLPEAISNMTQGMKQMGGQIGQMGQQGGQQGQHTSQSSTSGITGGTSPTSSK